MPRNTGTVTHMHEMSLDARQERCKKFQAHWYQHVIDTLSAGSSVLDVGAGTGYGITMLRSAGFKAEGIDPLPAGPEVHSGDIRAFDSDSWDVVLAIDVIEHVEEDEVFLNHLLRVAKHNVFLTTPNYNVSKCLKPYHIREYTPSELLDLMPDDCRFFTSGNDCTVQEPSNIQEFREAVNFGVSIRSNDG